MSWRNQGGITGSNNIPLGSRRRFGGSESTPPNDDGGYNPIQPLGGSADGGYKRGRSPERGQYISLNRFRILKNHQRIPSMVERKDVRKEIDGETLRKIRLQA